MNCDVGPMALTGSTRMQSATTLMYAKSLAVLGCDWMRKLKSKKDISFREYALNNLNQFIEYVRNHDFAKMVPFVEYESQLYKEDKFITYYSDPYYAISILGDTT